LALEELCGSGRAIAVLGDMLELGEDSEAAHLEVGRLVAALGIDVLVTVGRRAERILQSAALSGAAKAYSAESHEAAAAWVLELAKSGDVVLVKGSRGMAMENVVNRLTRGRE
jgi:UDP-N-acetylmuramoyl-tripeptide--D-alanyl-D-alanine ligase